MPSKGDNKAKQFNFYQASDEIQDDSQARSNDIEGLNETDEIIFQEAKQDKTKKSSDHPDDIIIKTKRTEQMVPIPLQNKNGVIIGYSGKPSGASKIVDADSGAQGGLP
jgi:hypothetical protein